MQTHDQILHALSQGIHPRSGERLAPDHLLHEPDVIRALHAAINALRRSEQKRANRSLLPERQGNAWTAQEEQLVTAAFRQGKSIPEIATQQCRTDGAIQRRLEKLGIIPSARR